MSAEPMDIEDTLYRIEFLPGTDALEDLEIYERGDVEGGVAVSCTHGNFSAAPLPTSRAAVVLAPVT